jgi:hypothetical protein
MSKFTIEDILVNRVEELEDAHHELFVMFTMCRKVLEDIALARTDRQMREMAEDVLRDLGASVK